MKLQVTHISLDFIRSQEYFFMSGFLVSPFSRQLTTVSLRAEGSLPLRWPNTVLARAFADAN